MPLDRNAHLDIQLGLHSLDSSLHRLEPTPIIAILCQRPRKNTTQSLGHDNVLELASSKLRRIPRPEDFLLRIPPPLSAQLLVCNTVGDGVLESASISRCFKGDGAGKARVVAFGILEHGGRAADGSRAVDAGSSGEILCVKGEAEVDLAGGEAALDVSGDGGERVGDTGVMGGCVHTTHHEVVSHDLEGRCQSDSRQ